MNLFNCRGSIVKVSGLTVESNGPSVGLGDLCAIHIREGKPVLAEVVGFQNNHIILLPLEHISGISPGDTVSTLTAPRYLLLSTNVLGRVLNGLGEPIDNKGPLEGRDKKALDANSPSPLSREKITKPLPLGIRSIDGILTCRTDRRAWTRGQGVSGIGPWF